MKALPFLSLLFLLLQTACNNPFHDPSLDITYPDTAVIINSLSPQICEVKVSETDSFYNITSYWTDKWTGNLVYKMKYDPYENGRLHGVQLAFDDKGDTLLIAHFEQGIRVDSTVYKYPNGQVKQIFYYSNKRNGNIVNELNFHPNGMRKSDVIAYNNGLLNGAVTYYDATARNRATETYYYVNSEIVGIKIYNEDYIVLENRKNAMLSAYRQDSARIAKVLMASLFSDDHDHTAAAVPVVYVGTKKDALHDVGDPDLWDILVEDPNFILKLQK